MKIFVVTGEPFPYGRAATNRIISYGKGFREHGVETQILCLRANNTDKNLGLNKKGVYEKIPYEYVSGTPYRPKNFIFRRYVYFKGLIRSIFIICKKYSKSKAIIVHTNEYFIIIFFKVLSLIFNYTIFQEKSEFPFVLKNKSLIGKFWTNIYLNTIYCLFDGILCETEKLRFFLKKYSGEKTKFLIVPSTIIPNKILEEPTDPESEKYIFYCGSLDKDKGDGLPILINAFSLITDKYQELKLIISGFSSNKKDVQELIELSKRLQIEKKVIFTGRVTDAQLVYFQKNAAILALAKENNEIQSGGLSSKIIEYLYTGNPVVLTELSEITNHLKNNETVFFCTPGSSQSMAEKFIYVLENPIQAKKIGLKGQEYALNTFDYYLHTGRIINFINSFYE